MSCRAAKSTCVLLSLLAMSLAAPAQEKPPATQPEVKFKLVKTPYAVEITEGDVLAEAFHYVAVVRVASVGFGTSNLRDFLASCVRNTPKDVLASDYVRSFLATQGDRAIRCKGARMPDLGPRGMSPSSGYRMPARTVRPGAGGMIGSPQPSPQSEAEFVILAANAERAKELVRGLIVAYNHGWARTERQEQLAWAKAEESRLPELKAQLAKAQQGFAEVDVKWRQYEDIGKDALSALKTEKWLLAVKLPGVEARLIAAKELLGRREKLPAGQVGQVEGIYIASQIELAGLLASKAKVDLLVTSAAKREQLSAGYNRAKSAVTDAELTIERAERKIEAHRGAANAVSPLKLLDAEVPIHPVKWVRLPAAGRPAAYPRRTGVRGAGAYPSLQPPSGAMPSPPGGRR